MSIHPFEEVCDKCVRHKGIVKEGAYCPEVSFVLACASEVEPDRHSKFVLTFNPVQKVHGGYYTFLFINIKA
jgi:hypothetical protein